MTALFTYFLRSGRSAAHVRALKANQRVDPERLELAPFHQFGAAMRSRPRRQTLERKFRPQAQLVRFLREQAFNRSSEAAFVGFVLVRYSSRLLCP